MTDSRKSKKTSHKILATIGVIFALILIVPYFINWGSFKAPIVNAVKELTGRDLTIDGAIRITLLPTPTLKVENIKLSNVEGASTPDMVTLKSLDFHLSFLPLLKGQINVAKLELVEPIITLETLKDNRHSWDFTPKSKASAAPEASTTASDSSSSVMAGLALQHVHIKNGSVVIKNPTSTQKIENINITGQMQSLTGPYTIQGSIQSGETILKTEASVGKFEDNLPIKISLNINQNSKDFGTAQIEGTVNLKEQKFSGKLNAPFAISTIIDLPKKKIDLNKGLSFTSDIDASANAVNLTNIKVVAEDIKVVGTANLLLPENKLSANFALKAAGSDADISIQGHLEDGFNGKVQLVSKNSEGLVSWFTTQKWPKIDLSSSVKTAKDSVKLDNISLVLGEASAKGDALIYTAKQEINANLQIPNINPWLNSSGSGKAEISATMNLQVKAGENQTQVILANVKIFGGEIKLHSVIDNKIADNLSYKVDLSAKDLSAAKLTQNPAKMGAINLTLQASGDSKAINIPVLDAKVTGLKSPAAFKGTANINLEKKRPLVKIDLEGAGIALDQLIAFEHKDIQTETNGIMLTAYTVPKDDNNLYLVSNTNTPWSNEPINLEALKAIDLDLTFKVKDLIYGNYKLDNTNITAHLQNGVLALSPISIALYGGKIEGEIHLDTSSNKIKTDLVLSNINLAQALEKSSITSVKKGVLNTEIHLTAAGKSSQAMISSLSGTTTVNVKDGTINNLNVKELIKRLKEFHFANLPSLLDALNAKGETTFSTIKADFKLQNGQATSDNLTLISEDVEATGKAVINLVQWILSVNANLKAKELSNFPPLAFKVEGSLNDPKYGLDMKQMQELLVKKGVSSLIDQFVGKQKNKSEPQDKNNSAQKSPTPINPEKIVKDIFKKLM
jgi:uncharacterized protein involved in outer membrane biogenesis